MSSIIRGSDNFDSGSVGPSTTRGDVGTYTIGGSNATTPAVGYARGATVAGSTIGQDNTGTSIRRPMRENHYRLRFVTQGLSGTWRNMGGDANTNNDHHAGTVWVRIS